MKQIVVLTMLTGLLTIQSCSETNTLTESGYETQVSLTGKVYGLGPDTIQCKQIQAGAQYLRTLLFINDSLFIEIIPADCGDIGSDFTCTHYYSGKYKTDYKNLMLNFDPQMAVHYIKSKSYANRKKGVSTHVQIEPSAMSIETLAIHNCAGTYYFEPCDVQRHLMAPTIDTLANHIKYIQSEGIMDHLFGKK